MAHKLTRLGGRLLGALGALILMAFLYVGVVLLDRPDADEQGMYAVTDEEITPLRAAQFTDPALLAESFGVEIPCIRGASMRGTARNAVYDGRTARLVTLDYDGLTITAVRPASAAPLLLRDQLSVSTEKTYTLLNIPATFAARGNERCFYFVTAAAAYAVYAPAMSMEDFLTAAGRLTLIH